MWVTNIIFLKNINNIKNICNIACIKNICNMKVSLKMAFSILDGRLSTNIGDVYTMLNFIFSDSLYTHQLPYAMDRVKALNPYWFAFGLGVIAGIKSKHNTNDYNELMNIIDLEYEDFEIELGKIDEKIPFL